MALHPVGPLPASTYWRRRLVVLLAVLLLVLLVRSLAGGEEGSPTPTPTPTTTSAPSSTPSAAASSRPSEAAAVTTCPDASLALETDTDAETYAVGGTPRITLTVKNTSTKSCRRDLGAGAVELLVFSGADRIWSSDDCSPSKAVALTTLGAGGTQAVVKTWPGTRSKPGCTGTKAAAQPGTYRVVARVGTLRVEGAVFRITG